MALVDVVFQGGEGQDFITEVPLGTLGTPTDILIDGTYANGQFPVLEIPLILPGGSTEISTIFVN